MNIKLRKALDNIIRIKRIHVISSNRTFIFEKGAIKRGCNSIKYIAEEYIDYSVPDLTKTLHLQDVHSCSYWNIVEYIRYNINNIQISYYKDKPISIKSIFDKRDVV